MATREFFPARLGAAVRQKTRWLHGIALQGWDRLGWSGNPLEMWMRLRDRRGPLTAVVLAAAYLLVLIAPVLAAGRWAGLYVPPPADPLMVRLLQFNFAALAWRLAMRMTFTMREYGFVEGLRAIVRLPLGNVIAIMAGRRAVMAYLASIHTGRVKWEHTVHLVHPTLAGAR